MLSLVSNWMGGRLAKLAYIYLEKSLESVFNQVTVAQLAEQQTSDQEIVCSNPTLGK